MYRTRRAHERLVNANGHDGGWRAFRTSPVDRLYFSWREIRYKKTPSKVGWNITTWLTRGDEGRTQVDNTQILV
jgi:hypothetical protein